MIKWKNRIPWLLVLLLTLGFHFSGSISSAPPPVHAVHHENLQPSETAGPSHPQTSAPRLESLSSHPAAQNPQAPLAIMMRRDFTGLTVTEHPDGRKSIHLGGRFQHVTRLVTLSNGQIIPKCFSSYDEMLEAADKIQTPSNDKPITPTADF